MKGLWTEHYTLHSSPNSFKILWKTVQMLSPEWLPSNFRNPKMTSKSWKFSSIHEMVTDIIGVLLGAVHRSVVAEMRPMLAERKYILISSFFDT